MTDARYQPAEVMTCRRTPFWQARRRLFVLCQRLGLLPPVRDASGITIFGGRSPAMTSTLRLETFTGEMP